MLLQAIRIMNPIPWLIDATFYGSLAILAVLALRPLVRRFCGARAAHALWVVAVLRLTLPGLPHTPIAMLPSVQGDAVVHERVSVRAWVEEGKTPDLVREQPSNIATPLPAETSDLSRWLVPGWLGVAFATFAFSLVGALRARRLVRRARDITGRSEIRESLASLPMRVPKLEVRETDELRSPALCGILRPVILLPPGWSQGLPQGGAPGGALA